MTLDQGLATVDFPARSIPAEGIDSGPRLILALLGTLASNEAVSEVDFQLGGDCFAFAVATQGDACSVVKVSEFLPRQGESR